MKRYLKTAAVMFLVSAPAIASAAPAGHTYSEQCRQSARDATTNCTLAGMAVGKCAATKSPVECVGAAAGVAKCANDINKSVTACQPTPRPSPSPSPSPSGRAGAGSAR